MGFFSPINATSVRRSFMPDLIPAYPAMVSRPPALNLLLVARDRWWTEAVTKAISDIHSVCVSACDAHGALARLSGTGEQFSHLLVEPDSAGGLLGALVDVTSHGAGSRTAMVILGDSPTLLRDTAVLRAPNQHAIRSTLTRLPTPHAALEGAMLPGELREALAGAMIETRYQPIVAMADGTLFALEALARLNHPVLGTLSPDRFIPQMEDAGLAARLTEVVSHCAFADMAGPVLANRGLRVTINFPLDVLLSAEALIRLEEQRVAAGIPADHVVVELTESRPVDDVVTLRRSLEWLRERGYRAAIDDVGPAVPRLAPLLELPFTALKLDMALVQQVESDKDVAAFLEATTRQAKARGLAVVAEGVETTAIWRRMKAMGVDAAQGFLVARPLPVNAVPIWLRAWNAGPRID